MTFHLVHLNGWMSRANGRLALKKEAAYAA